MAVQIILKNSSIEDKRPQASQLTNGEISLNYSSAGAFLCCTDTNGDVQQVGGVKIDETAPDAPVKQTLWFKPSTLTLSVFDGDKWLPIAGGGGGGGGGGGDIIQIIGNDGIDADTVSGIVTLDVELAGGDDGLEFKSSKLSATLASATDLGSVKVGDNINVTAGKISVPKATSSTFGVVKLGDGIEIDGDGSISIDVPTTTTYRGSCDLNTPPTGQINPDPALKGDAYINSADAPAVDAGWTGITGSAKIGDLVIFDGTQWDLIPLGAGTAPVTSVNGKTGDVVLDYTDVGAASAAQGDLADTALQPGDNISELNNDEGYITAAEAPVQSVNGKTGVVVLDAADVGALAPGDNVSLLANDAEYISKGDPVSDLDNDAGYITLADLPDIPDQEPPVIISDTAPTGDDAVEGNLWFNSNDGRTYVYYKDGDSSQWVDASPDSGGAGGTVGDYWLEAGGYLSPKDGTNGVDIGGSKIQLNTDGGAYLSGGIHEFRQDSSVIFSPRPNVGGPPNADATIFTLASDTQPGEILIDALTSKAIAPYGAFSVRKRATDSDAPVISSQWRWDDQILLGGLIPDKPNIQLNGTDGSITAEGTGKFSTVVNVGNWPNETSCSIGGGAYLVRQDADTSVVFRTYNGGTDAADITYQVVSTGDVQIGGTIDRFIPTNSAPAIWLNADGSGVFKEKLVVNNPSATDTDSLLKIVSYNGSLGAGSNNPAVLDFKGNGDLIGECGAAKQRFSISAVTGTATFANNVVSGIAGSTAGIGSWIQPAGGIYTTRAAGSTDALFAGFQKDDLGPRFSVLPDGSGYFAGTVTAAGHVFNLEADDPTKYITEVDEEGNETQTYIGTTLDVKDRLQKADAALLALKAAAAAATDFASLQAAIVTALADI